MSEPMRPQNHDQDRDQDRDHDRRWHRALLTVIAAGVVVIAAVLLIDLVRDTDDEISSPTTASIVTVPPGGTMVIDPSTTDDTTTVPATTEPATTTTEPATTTTEPATTTTTDPVAQELRNAIYPTPAMSVTYDDPVAVVRDFVTNYVGFTEPLVSEFMAGDSRSGEVNVMAGDVGPITTVFVRQLGDSDSWSVIGAATANIVVDEPQVLDVVTSPLDLIGAARAFEGTVNVELRADDITDPLYEGFVTGSGGPDPGEFESTIEFVSPGEQGGALLFVTYSPRDGTVTEAGALRVFFAAE